MSRTLYIETFGPDDKVFEEGEISLKMYFIQSGIVEIIHSLTQMVFIQLKAKDYFGEIAFFADKPRCASARCFDYVDLFTVERSAMNSLLEKFPEAKEKSKAIAEKC